MATVYCGACGAGLTETARFCRACGTAQLAEPPAAAPPRPAAPQPAAPPPPPTAWPPAGARSPAATGPLAGAELVAAALAIVGGAAMCFLVLFAVVYSPLHDDYSVNYGIGVRFGDVLAFCSGLVAIAIGGLILARRPGNPTGRGIWLVVAGTPTLIVTLMWVFGSTLDLTTYPLPFYFAFVYFTDLGVVHLGDHYLPLVVLAACAMPVAAGVAIASAKPVPSPARP